MKPRNRETELSLGIIAREEEAFPPFGKQSFFFQDMAEAGSGLPVSLFVFSPLRWNGTAVIRGYRYDGGRWLSGEEPIPSLIYDRFTAKEPGEKEAYLAFRSFLVQAQRRFLNPLPLVELTRNKVAFHHFLSGNGLPTLPAIPLHELTPEQIQRLLSDDKTIYLKPAIGSNGAHISTVELLGDGYCLIRGEAGQARVSRGEVLAYLRSNWPADAFFVQPKARMIPFEERAYDVRVLVQNHGGSEYRLTGMGVRFGEQGSWVSNISAGGSALPLDRLQPYLAPAGVEVKKLEAQIADACLHCTRLLHDRYGDFVEMAYDLLLTVDDGPIFLEANAKPARWIFTVMADALEKDDPAASGFYRNVRRQSVRIPLLFVHHSRL